MTPCTPDREGTIQIVANLLELSDGECTTPEERAERIVDALLGQPDPEGERLREQLEEARIAGQLPRTDDLRYDLRQQLNRAVRALRDAEDIARLEMPGWSTADRIRSIYEQVTADVLNGKTTIPPISQQLREAEERLLDFRRAITEHRTAIDNAGTIRVHDASDALVADAKHRADERLWAVLSEEGETT